MGEVAGEVVGEVVRKYRMHLNACWTGVESKADKRRNARAEL